MTQSTKDHWQLVYQNNKPDQVSWTQRVPQTSLDFVRSFALEKTAKIIDIGGGDSRLVDYLLHEGYENISVLDISAKALEKAKKRLGKKAAKVNWIVSDITKFEPESTFDLWHDRATFHFLTSSEQITKYLNIARRSVNKFLIIGTFSNNGPEQCSGLDIKQYDEDTLTTALSEGFRKIRCIQEDHITPFSTSQDFLFCSFKKIKSSLSDKR